jgi:hypothetical protein
MHLIDHSTAAVGNQFTDGNAGTGIPATRVTAKWLNNIQNELANFITSRGITLSDASATQLKDAIASAVESTSSTTLTVANNTTVETALTGMILDKTKFKSAEFLCDIYRKTATLEYNSLVKLSCIFRPIANSWKIIVEEIGDSSGATFYIDTSTGQVKYKSSNMAGGTYVGELRYTVKRINL